MRKILKEPSGDGLNILSIFDTIHITNTLGILIQNPYKDPLERVCYHSISPSYKLTHSLTQPNQIHRVLKFEDTFTSV